MWNKKNNENNCINFVIEFFRLLQNFETLTTNNNNNASCNNVENHRIRCGKRFPTECHFAYAIPIEKEIRALQRLSASWQTKKKKQNELFTGRWTCNWHHSQHTKQNQKQFVIAIELIMYFSGISISRIQLCTLQSLFFTCELWRREISVRFVCRRKNHQQCSILTNPFLMISFKL